MGNFDGVFSLSYPLFTLSAVNDLPCFVVKLPQLESHAWKSGDEAARAEPFRHFQATIAFKAAIFSASAFTGRIYGKLPLIHPISSHKSYDFRTSVLQALPTGGHFRVVPDKCASSSHANSLLAP